MPKHDNDCDCADCIQKRAFSLSAKSGIPIDFAKRIIMNEIASARELEEKAIEETKIKEQIRQQKESEEIHETLKRARKKVSYAKKKLESVQKLEAELTLARQKIEDLENRLKATMESRQTHIAWRESERTELQHEIDKLNKELQKAYSDFAKVEHEHSSNYWLEFRKIERYYEDKIKYLEAYYKEWLQYQDNVLKRLRTEP